MVAIHPIIIKISSCPPNNKYPNTADITIDPDVANVFNIESAYFSVAIIIINLLLITILFIYTIIFYFL